MGSSVKSSSLQSSINMKSVAVVALCLFAAVTAEPEADASHHAVSYGYGYPAYGYAHHAYGYAHHGYAAYPYAHHGYGYAHHGYHKRSADAEASYGYPAYGYAHHGYAAYPYAHHGYAHHGY